MSKFTVIVEEIELYPSRTKLRGRTVPCIRVRATALKRLKEMVG